MNLPYKDIVINDEIVRIVTVPQYILDDDLQTEIYQTVLEEMHQMSIQLVADINALIVS